MNLESLKNDKFTPLTSTQMNSLRGGDDTYGLGTSESYTKDCCHYYRDDSERHHQYTDAKGNRHDDITGTIYGFWAVTCE